MKPVPLLDKTRTVGKPKEWIEELDGPIQSLDVFDYVDPLTGINYMRTGWLIEPNDKGIIWLDIAGTTFPVIRWQNDRA